jgi:hypothetical protein
LTPTERLVRRVAAAGLLCTALLAHAAELTAQSRVLAGAIDGVVTTEHGTIPLGGVEIAVRRASAIAVTTVYSEADGRFHVDGLPPGSYTVSSSLSGFDPDSTAVVVAAGKTTRLDLNLRISNITTTVDVVPESAVVSTAQTLAHVDSIDDAETDRFSPGGGLQAALRLLASVIEVPGGLSIKGGRPTQAATQIGAGTLVEPSIGLSHFTLPGDAIASVSVLPNPYAVEYGRFSSGLVVIQTRRAGDKWHLRLDNLEPSFRGERGKDLYTITGIADLAPQVQFGGPLVKERMFVQQTVQAWYSSNSVLSRPEDELQTTRAFSSFTRVDANLSPQHSVLATAGFYPSASTDAMLGTFTPPETTANVHERVGHGALTERALWSDSLVGESTVQADTYQIGVVPQGSLPLVLSPDSRTGNYYNTQSRVASTVQWIETVSGSKNGPFGLHLFKVGLDLLYSDAAGSSSSRPILIRRDDGTLARRLTFAPMAQLNVTSTDVALFAQDRLRPSTRWYVEYGARADRDGVLDRWNVTPRVGAALLLNEAGTRVLRGGIGMFYERTPSAAGAFEQFEGFTDARFGADGSTLLSATPFTHVSAPELHTARSRTVDVSYDYRWNRRWAMQASALDRRGSHELIVEPLVDGGLGALMLSSSGQSVYREASATVHFTPAVGTAVHATYTRSVATSDTNPFSSFFDAFMWPIVGPNSYTVAGSDVPNRVIVRGEVMPTRRWLLLGTLDWRNGSPYSVFDESLDYVGVRNSWRMPNPLRVDLGIERRFHILHRDPWIGIRAYNALGSFLPSDVQANIGSRAFGSFYNSEYRQLRLQVRFDR